MACSLCECYSHYVAHGTIKKHYVLEVEAVQVMMQNNNKNKLSAAFSFSETAALCIILRFMQQQGEKVLCLSLVLPPPHHLSSMA